jgi:predicted nucleic acid-binding protein
VLDGLYIAAAEARGAVLLTTDQRLARAVDTVETIAPS